MKRKNFLLLALLSLTISACHKTSRSSSVSSSDTLSSTSQDSVTETYTVTWANYDGTVLQVDESVPYGTLPVYNGATPTKASTAEYSFTFAGWDQEVTIVTSDITYTATYTENVNYYNVTWQNEDEIVLAVDRFVYGAMPFYSGSTPTKEATRETYFIFSGWTPALTVVTSDATYTATFTARTIGEDVPGVDPVFSSDAKSVQYGFYPQSYVQDRNTVTTLNNLEPNDDNLYMLEGTYYTKEKARLYNNESYTFTDGTMINNGTDYWFKYEVITWDVLNASDGSFYLLSRLLLDAKPFYFDYEERVINHEVVYPNNYEHSSLRSWLNDDFYSRAFFLNHTYIEDNVTNNSASSTDNINNRYASSNTTDKVFLPSYEDYLTVSYGFEAENKLSATRTALTTDYARAVGAWSNTTNNNLKYNGSYWTRSATSEYSYTAWNVNSGGYLSMYAVDGTNHSVRPSISISFA